MGRQQGGGLVSGCGTICCALVRRASWTQADLRDAPGVQRGHKEMTRDGGGNWWEEQREARTRRWYNHQRLENHLPNCWYIVWFQIPKGFELFARNQLLLRHTSYGRPIPFWRPSPLDTLWLLKRHSMPVYKYTSPFPAAFCHPNVACCSKGSHWMLAVMRTTQKGRQREICFQTLWFCFVQADLWVKIEIQNPSGVFVLRKGFSSSTPGSASPHLVPRGVFPE